MEASIATFRPNMVLMSWSVMALGAGRGWGCPLEQRSARGSSSPAGGWRERKRTQIGEECGESFDTHSVVLALGGREKEDVRERKGGSIWGFGWSASRHTLLKDASHARTRQGTQDYGLSFAGSTTDERSVLEQADMERKKRNDIETRSLMGVESPPPSLPPSITSSFGYQSLQNLLKRLPLHAPTSHRTLHIRREELSVRSQLLRRVFPAHIPRDHNNRPSASRPRIFESKNKGKEGHTLVERIIGVRFQEKVL